MNGLALFAEVYAYVAAAPFVVFVVVWIAVYRYKNDKRKATALSMDVTTCFLIGSVAAMMDNVLALPFGAIWLLVLVFLLGFGLLGNAQQRLRGRVDWRKLVRSVWRLGFLGLSVLYVVFLAIGIGMYVSKI